MAKNKNDLGNLGLDATSAPAKKEEDKKAKNAKAKTAPKKKLNVAKYFRELISELKKVEWAPMRRTKNNEGVLAQTGTVLLVTLFFTIVITLFDAGFGELLKLFLQAATPVK